MVKSEGDRLRQVIVCSPRREYFQVDDLKAHNIEALANPALAQQQHDQLKAVLREAGAEVIDLAELKGHPNSVFTRDTALITPEGYIQLRMGLPTRRGEERWMARALAGLGIPCAGQIKAPGTVEGGDVILAWPVAFIGCSARTNESGSRQLARLLEKMGYEPRLINLPPNHLHLGGVMSLVGPKTVLCCRGVLPPSFLEGFDVIYVPDTSATSGNVVCLGKNEAIASKENKAAIRALRRAGFTAHELDLSEFIKGSGGPTCLILPILRK
jgi:dimethylargininase